MKTMAGKRNQPEGWFANLFVEAEQQRFFTADYDSFHICRELESALEGDRPIARYVDQIAPYFDLFVEEHQQRQDAKRRSCRRLGHRAGGHTCALGRGFRR